jgi:phage/plasmid-associated DNA primase
MREPRPSRSPFSEQGFAAFDAWSRKAPTKYGGTEKAWASFDKNPPTRIGFGTLFYKARQADPSWRPPSLEVISNPFSEDGMARLFAERHADRVRYVPMWGRWLLWNGTVWRQDERLEAFAGARVVCRDTAKLTKDGGAKYASAKTVAAVVTLSKAGELLVTAPSQWDADDWGLGGDMFVDLRTGIARRPCPEDYNTKGAGAAPAPPKTPHPIWTGFLDRITAGDKDIVGFLQRFCGYCLTGVTTEQVLAFFYGTGANGKSVFVGTIAGILGDYAGEWIEEALDCRDPRSWTRTLDLFDTWKQWCEPRNLPHGSAKSFSEALEERGLAKKRDGSGRQGFSGVTFRQSPKQV